MVREAARPPPEVVLLFERFTENARRVVIQARDEARLFDHDYIGTEHLLLGLLRVGEGVAAEVLASVGVGHDAVRGQVEEIIGQGERTPSGEIPFTCRAKKVLELSLRESLQLGNNFIGSEHILAGLLREGQGVGVKALRGLDVDLHQLRNRVLHAIQRSEDVAGQAGAMPFAPMPEMRSVFEGRLGAVDENLSVLKGRLGAADENLSVLKEWLVAVEGRVDALYEDLGVLKERMGGLEEQMSALEERMGAADERPPPDSA